MPIRSLGNSSVRYNAVMRRTGNNAGPPPISMEVDYDWGGGRGINGGGWAPGSYGEIGYITIASTGNSSDFGNLTAARAYVGHVAGSNDRGVMCGGHSIGNVIDYVNIASTGNASDFGDPGHTAWGQSGVSSGTRGCWAGDGPGYSANEIDYITIASTGNASSFGELAQSSPAPAYMAGVTNGTRGLYVGGGLGSGNNSEVMEYITIASTGNGTDFGDIDNTSRGRGGTDSDEQRAVFSGGWAEIVDTISYTTISTLGDTTDFGELTVARGLVASCSNGLRGCTSGGADSPSTEWVDTIDYVTMETTGNATDFGDSIVDCQRFQACSGN